MLARIWRGVTPAEKADEYLDYLNQTGIPDYLATLGNRGAFVLRHEVAEYASLRDLDQSYASRIVELLAATLKRPGHSGPCRA